MFTRVLILYDGSAASRRAVQRGIEIAKGSAARIYLLSAIPRTLPPEVLWACAAGSVTLLDPRAADERWLRDAARDLLAQGLDVEVLKAHGEPIDEIADCSKRLRIDLIVVGRYPSPPGRRWLSAGDRRALAERVDCCVLIGQ